MGLIDTTKAMESIDEIVCSMSVCINSDYCNGMRTMKDMALHAIEKQPTVDAVPVVRCKDCKYCYAEGFVNVHNVCEKHYDFGNVDDDWFCADGERRTD